MSKHPLVSCGCSCISLVLEKWLYHLPVLLLFPSAPVPLNQQPRQRQCRTKTEEYHFDRRIYDGPNHWCNAIYNRFYERVRHLRFKCRVGSGLVCSLISPSCTGIHKEHTYKSLKPNRPRHSTFRESLSRRSPQNFPLKRLCHTLRLGSFRVCPLTLLPVLPGMRHRTLKH